jgi:hypothetical protein
MQLALKVCITICVADIGFLLLVRRGCLNKAILALYGLSGIFADYSSCRLHKSVRGRHWQYSTVEV